MRIGDVEMQITRQELVDIVQTTVDATIRRLLDAGVIGASASSANASASASANATGKRKRGRPKQDASASASRERSAYAQTEALLFNYNNFKKIIAEKEQEIADIYRYGVSGGGSAIVQYSKESKGYNGIVLTDEQIEAAVTKVRKSIEQTVEAVEQIDKCLLMLSKDPYYRILEMRYFEGRTQEDIAVEFGCTQSTISDNKNRLVRELSIKLFPDKVVAELTKNK